MLPYLKVKKKKGIRCGRTWSTTASQQRELVWLLSLTWDSLCEVPLWPWGHGWVSLLLSCLTFMWQQHQRVRSCDVLFLPPSPLFISSLFHHSCGRSGTKPSQDKCIILMVGKRRRLYTLYSQYLSLDSLKLNGVKNSWAVRTSLRDSDSERFFPVLPLT